MSRNRALAMVLELAEGNMADPNELPEEYDAQARAIAIVQALAMGTDDDA